MPHLFSSSLTSIGAFTLVILVVYFTSRYKYLTQKAIIEKGGNIEFPKYKPSIFWLALGGIAIGVGIGLILAAIVQNFEISEDSKEMLTGAFILLFAGIGLILANIFKKKFEKSQSK